MGTWVYVKLKPYRQHSVAHREHQKFAAKYYGPYEIIKKVGQVAYTLKLPATARIHPTFHVSMLKQHVGPVPSMPDNIEPPVWTDETEKAPVKVVEIRTVKRRNYAVVQWLVQWDAI